MVPVLYLKDGGLVVLLEVIGEDVGVHQGAPTVAQDVQALLQELDLCQEDKCWNEAKLEL